MSVERDADLCRRAAVHAALADPARLAVVDLLCVGDASPSELQAALDLPSNLLAHHLRVLEQAGVVERSRSEGDRRRTYLTLVAGSVDRLQQVRPRTAPRVLFVCTRNSARSQLAVALWRRRSTVPVASAGTEPADRVHPAAIAAARRHGLSLRRSRPAHVDDVAQTGDLVVAVCDNAHEGLPHGAPRLHWSVADPVRAGTDAAFDRAVNDLADRIDAIAPHIRPS
jgi:protein-tyrosine-phosphatase/DNA-binding HxlR family transcriptional regulator